MLILRSATTAIHNIH